MNASKREKQPEYLRWYSKISLKKQTKKSLQHKRTHPLLQKSDRWPSALWSSQFVCAAGWWEKKNRFISLLSDTNHTPVHNAAVVCQAGVLSAEFIISSLTTILHKEHEGCVWGRDLGKHHASQQRSHRHTLIYGRPEWPADTEKSNSLCLLFNLLCLNLGFMKWFYGQLKRGAMSLKKPSLPLPISSVQIHQGELLSALSPITLWPFNKISSRFLSTAPWK